MKFIKFVWLALAIAAFAGVCCGASHHVITFGISALMYVICRHDSEEEKA